MPTRNDLQFNPTPQTTRTAPTRTPASLRRTAVGTDAFAVERRSIRLPNGEWTTVTTHLRHGEALRAYEACLNSPLAFYHQCRFRLRRGKDNKILREADHRKAR